MLCINLRLGTASLAGCMPEVLPRAVAALFSIEREREGVAELVGSVVNERTHCLYSRAHKIDFHEYDVPAPPAGGVVAEVTQTNVCGSEVHIWRGEFGGRNGTMPGHR